MKPAVKQFPPALAAVLYMGCVLNAMPAAGENKTHRQNIEHILTQSVFNQALPPEHLINGQLTHYDPVVIGPLANLYSTSPPRDDSQYQKILLPPGELSTVCPRPLSAYVKLSQKKHPYTFVLLPGSYSSWESGQFNNQTIAALEEHFDDPTIIGFSGYLSPAFLTPACSQIPWDAVSLARDIRLRLKKYLQSISADPLKTGVVGFSGGGGLAIAMAGEDGLRAPKHPSAKAPPLSNPARAELQNNPPVFGLGGAVFSPTLHGLTIFKNIDTAVKSIDHQDTLSTPDFDFDHLYFFAEFALSDRPKWALVYDFYQTDPKEFTERSFNELTFVKLNKMLGALGRTADSVPGGLGYYNVFVLAGAGEENPHVPQKDIDSFYTQKINLKPAFKTISTPFLIYFSKDDPVNSSYTLHGRFDGPMASAITDLLNTAQTNPHIIVFNPKYGGHDGIVLDPIFPRLLQAVFTPPTDSK